MSNYKYLLVLLSITAFFLTIPLGCLYMIDENRSITLEMEINEKIKRKLKIRGGFTSLNNKFDISLYDDGISTFNYISYPDIDTPFDLIKNSNSDTIWIIKGNDKYFRILPKRLNQK